MPQPSYGALPFSICIVSGILCIYSLPDMACPGFLFHGPFCEASSGFRKVTFYGECYFLLFNTLVRICWAVSAWVLPTVVLSTEMNSFIWT
jgi:hypothetical protein